MESNEESNNEPLVSRTARRYGLKKRRHFVVVVVVALVLIVGCFGAYFYLTHQSNRNWNDVAYVTNRVAQHMLLPTDETPALLTVTDSTKLTTTFLKQAQNGDKILIYQNNKKAIIYRPSLDRVIAIGPVVIDDVSNTGN